MLASCVSLSLTLRLLPPVSRDVPEKRSIRCFVVSRVALGRSGGEEVAAVAEGTEWSTVAKRRRAAAGMQSSVELKTIRRLPA